MRTKKLAVMEELAKELNVTEMTIRNTAKKLGIHGSKSTFSDIKFALIKQR